VPISPKSLAPGIYIQEVTSLRHPLSCVSTGMAGLIGLASRAPAGIIDFAKLQGAVVHNAGSHLPLAGGINRLHFFPARGNQIWGARTTSAPELLRVSNLHNAHVLHELAHLNPCLALAGERSALEAEVFNLHSLDVVGSIIPDE
jgi:phage tail sheath protein FI